jgi:hypothetical protein
VCVCPMSKPNSEEASAPDAAAPDAGSTEAQSLPQLGLPPVTTSRIRLLSTNSVDHGGKRLRPSASDSLHVGEIEDQSDIAASRPPVAFNDATQSLGTADAAGMRWTATSTPMRPADSFWYILVVDESHEASGGVRVSGELSLLAGGRKISQLKQQVQAKHECELQGIVSINVYSSDGDELGVGRDWNVENHGGASPEDPLVFTASRDGQHNRLLRSKCAFFPCD